MAGAVLALATAGCGGSDAERGDEGSRTATTPPPTVSAPEGAEAKRPAPPAGTPEPPKGGAILRDDRFQPVRVRTDSSGAITFVNQDDHEHRIAIGDGAVVPVRAKSSVSTPPPRPGTYRLVCRIHQEGGMVGELVVKR